MTVTGKTRSNAGLLDMLGLVNIILGLSGTALCVAALGMSSIQAFLIKRVPELSAHERVHEIVSDTWLTYMPLGALLGVLFALTGPWLRHGDRKGRTASWCVVLALVVWFVGYCRSTVLHRNEYLEALGGTPPLGFVIQAFTIGCVAIMAITLFAYPVLLLFLLRRLFPEESS